MRHFCIRHLERVPGCGGNISNTLGCFAFAVTNSPALAESFSQENAIVKTSHTGINSHLSTEGLLKSCQYRISFLTTIATEEPELICSDDCLSGFLDVLRDVEQMLRCVISKIHTEGAL